MTTMYAFIQNVPIDEQFYRRVRELIGPEPLSGQLLHLCMRLPEGGLRYIDVWESEELFQRAFGDRILPAVDAAFGGNRPDREPDIQPLDIIDASGPLLAATSR